MSGHIEDFRQRNCAVLAISTDSIEEHERWLSTPPSQGGLGAIQFPLASDDDGAVSRSYGVYLERQHWALRGLFIIDPNGVLQYQVVHSLNVGRSSEEVLRVLQGLQMGGLCAGERLPGEPAIDVLRELGPGRVIGQYQIEAILGVGAFGSVFRARDLMLERTVALKVLRLGGPVSSQSLLAEARAAAALNHPNICVIHAVDTSNGAPMIVMEHVDGEPLADRLTAGGLSPPTVVAFARQIAAGLATAHAQGIVHGDLKPSNVMVTPNGVVKIMDFGLARRTLNLSRDAETVVFNTESAGAISGTLHYMSPEQSRGESLTPASDVFSFGLVLIEMLTGRRTITGTNLLETLHQIERFDAAPYVEQLNEPFASIVREALIRNPSERHISMAEIAKRLSESSQANEALSAGEPAQKAGG